MSEIDPQAVLHHAGYTAYDGLEPMTGGWANAMWRFGTPDGVRRVLRVYSKAEWAPGARREEAALRAAGASGIPVPALEYFGTWHDLPVMVISWCPGEPLLAALQRRPWRLWRLGRECGRLQARIHSVAPPSALVEGAPDYWLAALRSALPASNGFPEVVATSLVHFDYHPLNILVDGHGVTAVVDWTNAAAGDPRVDVARTISLVSAGPIPPGPLRPLLSLGRSLLLRAWLRGYQAEAGALGDLAPFLYYCGLFFLADVEDAVREGRGWARERDLAAIRRWTERWQRRAGLKASE